MGLFRSKKEKLRYGEKLAGVKPREVAPSKWSQISTPTKARWGFFLSTALMIGGPLLYYYSADLKDALNEKWRKTKSAAIVAADNVQFSQDVKATYQLLDVDTADGKFFCKMLNKDNQIRYGEADIVGIDNANHSSPLQKKADYRLEVPKDAYNEVHVQEIKHSFVDGTDLANDNPTYILQFDPKIMGQENYDKLIELFRANDMNHDEIYLQENLAIEKTSPFYQKHGL